MSEQGNPAANPSSRTYIHRRFAVRFLLVLLVALSVGAFAGIALGWGEAADPVSEEDSATPTKLSDMSPFYVLLIGSDSLAGTALYTGDVISSGDDDPDADSLLLVRVDPAECVLTFVTVPSNTVLDSDEDPLRETLEAGDATQTVRAVERVTGVEIRYYFTLGFAGFEALVDQVGDVTEEVPVSITMQDPVTARPVTVPSGEDVELDAAKALAYLRSWDPYVSDADAHRQLNVRNVLAGLVGNVLDSPDEQVRKDLGALEDAVQTNIGDSTLLSLVTRFYDERENVRIYACTGPYLSTEVNDDGEAVIRLQMAAWRQLMSAVDAGENPAKTLPQYAFQDSADDYVQQDGSSSAAEPDASSGSASSASDGTSGSAAGSAASGASSSRAADDSESASGSAGASASSADAAYSPDTSASGADAGGDR